MVQLVRLLDVFLLGPFLWRVSRRRGLSTTERRVLELAALGTIAFNGVRFLQEARD